MKHHKMVGAFALTLLLGMAGCPSDDPDDDDTGDDDAGDDDTGDDDTGDDDWDPRFDPLVEAMQLDIDESSATAISVAVLEGGEITFAEAFGSAHPEQYVEVTPDTLFQIGSVSKMMSATALLTKVEEGEVALDDTLAEAAPGLEFTFGPERHEQIEVHHLLTHQGGFVDSWCATGPTEDSWLSEYGMGGFSSEWRFQGPTGVFFNYANPNYSLVGLVTENADTRVWGDIVEQDVLQPLGMDRTFTRRASVEADGDYALGTGYYFDGDWQWGVVELEDTCDNAFYRPAGLIWSTPSQLVRFGEFLIDGDEDVLSQASWQELVSPQVSELAYGDEWMYGYGVDVWTGFHLDGGWVPTTEWYEVPMRWHGGLTYSYLTYLIAFPEQDLVVAMNANAYDAYMNHTYQAVNATLVGLPDPVAPPLPAPDPAAFEDHAGRYVEPGQFGEILVWPFGDTMYCDVPEYAGFNTDTELVPLTDINFLGVIGGYEYDWTFIADEGDGRSPYIRNRGWVATREGYTPARGGDGPPPTGGPQAAPPLDRERALPAQAAARAPWTEVR